MAAGSIVRLGIRHFMTYDSVEIHPCQGLNLITGPNGTGKSTLLCAMCLGLSGKPGHIGRSERISDFIKNGYNQAYIEIELFNSSGENIVIGRQINDGNNSIWTLNGKTSSQKAVDREIAKFNIQTNNLCQFLPQEKVSDFTKMNSKELLESTEQAVGDQSMFENHNKLKELTAACNETRSTLSNMKENLEKEMDSNKRLEGQVKQLKERDKHLNKIKLIGQKIPWVKYEKVREEVKVILGKKSAAEEHLKIASEKLEPLRKKVIVAKQEVRKEESNIELLDQSIISRKKQISVSAGDLEKLDSEYKNQKSVIEGKIAGERERALRIHELQGVRASMQQEYEDSQAGSEKFQAEYDGVKEQLRQKVVESSSISIELEQSKSVLSGLNMSLTETQNTQAKLLHEHEYRLSYLKRREPDAYSAVMWLRENAHLFRKRIYEPILTLLNIPDPQSTKYIENHIAYRDMTAFYAEDPDDMNKFLRILSDGKKLNINGIYAVPVPESQLQPLISKTDLRNFGLTHYLKELFSAPPLVMNYLCKQYGLHRIPIGYQYNSRRVKSILQEAQLPFNKFFAGDFMFKIKVSKYGNRTRSSVSQKISDKGLLKGTVDNYELDALKEKEQKLKIDIDMETQKFMRLTELDKQHVEAIERLRGKKKTLADKAAGHRNLFAKLQAINEQLQYAKRPTCNIKKEEQMLENLRDEFIQQKKSSLISQQTLHEETFVLEKDKLYSLFKHNFLAREREESDLALKTASTEYHGLQELRTKYERLASTMKLDLKRLKNEADRVINLSVTNAVSDFQEKFNELPNELDELENELARERARLHCLHNANPAILDEYKDREKLIEETKKTIEIKEREMENFETKITKVRDEWLPKIEALIEKISANFSRYFANLGCAGEVILDKTNNSNDYDKYGLSILVKFRDHEPLSQLSHAHHSGGECSVSTILFILSLQELTEVPFRVVDEINQGMDNINERNVFNLIAKSSCSKKKSQYFLITPKLLHNLDFPREMDIGIILNGLSSQPAWNFDSIAQSRRSSEES